jgi:hemoglobin-like flavoprotein
MTPHQIELVQKTFAQVTPIASAAADLFYGRLFETAPAVRRLFPDDMRDQKRKLMMTLGVVVSALPQIDTLMPAVRALGQRHAGYGARAEHFAPVGAALLWTLAQGLGDAFTPEVKDAWTVAYGVLSATMIEAMEEVKQAA